MLDTRSYVGAESATFSEERSEYPVSCVVRRSTCYRYCNMDYLILSASQDRDILDEVLTYDISCQHSKYFIQRMLGYAQRLRLDLSTLNIRHAIPKKHFPAHSPKHSIWSLNYLRWVGRTYGEWIEACWSCMNQLAASLKEMAPATRHEVMDCQWGAWNFQKLVGLGMFCNASSSLTTHSVS